MDSVITVSRVRFNIFILSTHLSKAALCTLFLYTWPHILSVNRHQCIYAKIHQLGSGSLCSTLF